MAFKKINPVDPVENSDIVQPNAIVAGTQIGQTMKIKGNIACEEDVTVQGKVSGKLKVGRTLLIGEYGEVKADIKADTVIIIGSVKGNITASGKVEIRSRGRFNGNLESDILVVEEGALLIGDVNQKKEKK